MIGCREFILLYDWTFEYLRRTYGPEAVEAYWVECISHDSQRHARELIIPHGFDGMEEYWGHTLAQEAAGYTMVRGEGVLRMDMHACPSQGQLKACGQSCYEDYCQHCLGWIGPLMADAGFVIHHEHNHECLCWWEFRAQGEDLPPSAPGELAGENDIRLHPRWLSGRIDRWIASVRQDDSNP